MTITYKTEYEGSEIVITENNPIDLLVTLRKLENAGLLAKSGLLTPERKNDLTRLGVVHVSDTIVKVAAGHA